MTTIWWVRHGPTHAKTMVGWTDLPADLSDRPALDRLSAYLPSRAPVVSSDLGRAVETASAISADRPRLPSDPRLREIHFGAWENLRHDDIPDQSLARRYWEAPGDVAPPEGESWNDLSKRADAATDALAALGHSDLIVVAHFGTILTQLQRALNVPAQKVFAQRIEPLSVTCITLGPHWSVGQINHIC